MPPQNSLVGSDKCHGPFLYKYAQDSTGDKTIISSEGARKGSPKVTLERDLEESVRWVCQLPERRQAQVPGRKEAYTKAQGLERAGIWGTPHYL